MARSVPYRNYGEWFIFALGTAEPFPIHDNDINQAPLTHRNTCMAARFIE